MLGSFIYNNASEDHIFIVLLSFEEKKTKYSNLLHICTEYLTNVLRYSPPLVILKMILAFIVRIFTKSYCIVDCKYV